MNLHQEDLLNLAKAGGFRAEMLEKVIRLIDLLNELFDNNFLRQRLVLKGGTALNLFYLDMPRLSVDIDLNYIGAIDRQTMLEERQELERTLFGLCQRARLTIKRAATEHAGGKWRLTFTNVVQPSGNLEIDISYLYRVTLWPVAVQDSYKIGLYQARNIPILDVHELAAGKLTALMSRHASRDWIYMIHIN
jgi:predicted nucleotidyltransferase component of viral defense system